MNKHCITKLHGTMTVMPVLLICLALVLGCDEALLDEGIENPLLLKFEPSLVKIEGTEQTIDVDVVVEEALSLIAARFSISFDPSVVEVTKIETSGNGYMFIDAGAQVSVLEGNYDNETGKIVVSIGALKKGFAGATGEGKLTTITFKSKKIDSTDLNFINYKPTDIFMSIFSTEDERGWEEQNVLTYSGVIIVREETEEETPQ